MLSEEVKARLSEVVTGLVAENGVEVVASWFSPSRFIGMICSMHPPSDSPYGYVLRENVRENRQEAERYVAALLGPM